MNKVLPKKVFVGLSGGVDSAVSAALLKEQGFLVSGVFIKVWQPDFLPCSWREERRDAMKVALALDIPFLFFDFSDEYKKEVVDTMITEYKKGRTPNPDVLCNKEVKFGAFWKRAKACGADYIATGHYARVEDGKLKEGKDKEKDQSYFLWTLTRDDLSHTLFPVGNLEKREVRELARKFSLPVSEKKDSQGICFIGDIEMSEFLSHFISLKSGKVLNTYHETIGTHKGALLYTIGERHGFEITKKKPNDGAFYVVAKDLRINTITVSNSEPEITSLSPTKVTVDLLNWTTRPKESGLTCRIRYRGEKLGVVIRESGKKVSLEFKAPVRGLSLGQSVVFYDKDICLGGGVMEEFS
ncbi:MAG: tRNA 2-thiouridine(34) synthase MnmA [Patescibacteria group bacterium]